MAIITAPITTTKVANTLGVSSRDVGTLCTSDRINKWAKYKPVCYYNTISGDADVICKAKYNNADGTGEFDNHSNGDYGLAPGYREYVNYNSASDHAALVKASNAYDWEYQQPTGGPEYPYRLGDFRGYDTSAQACISFAGVNGGTWDNIRQQFSVNMAETDTLTFQFNYNASDDFPNWVCADDIQDAAEIDFSRCYIIAAVYSSNGSVYKDLVSTIDTNGNGDPDNANGYIVNPNTGFPNDLSISLDLSDYEETSQTYLVYFAIEQKSTNQLQNTIFCFPHPYNQDVLSFPIKFTTILDWADIGLQPDITTIRVTPLVVNSSNASQTQNQKLLIECAEIGSYSPSYRMMSTTGHISFKITFSNSGDQSRTYNMNAFRLTTAAYPIGTDGKVCSYIRDESGTDIGNQFTIQADSEITVWLVFEDALSTLSSSDTNVQEEIELRYQDIGTILSATLWRGYGNTGFQSI